MPRAKTIIDIDAAFAKEGRERKSVDDFETVEILLFGETIRLLKGAVNIFGMIEAFDPDNPGNATKFLMRLVHPEDRVTFKTAVAQQYEFTGEDFRIMLEKMMEAVGEGNPSARSNGSGGSKPSTRRTTAKVLSAAK